MYTNPPTLFDRKSLTYVSRERYRLSVFLRFAELDSASGKGPLKISLQKLRNVRERPACGNYCEVSGKGIREKPCTKVECEEDGIRVIGSDQPISEKAPIKRPSVGTIRYSKNSDRVRLPAEGLSRAEKRNLRELEFIRRRTSEINSHRESLKSKPGLQDRNRVLARMATSVRDIRKNEPEEPIVRGVGVEIPPPAVLTTARPSRNPVPVSQLRLTPYRREDDIHCSRMKDCKRGKHVRGRCSPSPDITRWLSSHNSDLIPPISVPSGIGWEAREVLESRVGEAWLKSPKGLLWLETHPRETWKNPVLKVVYCARKGTWCWVDGRKILGVNRVIFPPGKFRPPWASRCSGDHDHLPD